MELKPQQGLKWEKHPYQTLTHTICFGSEVSVSP
jgi:hypothetical protein